MRRSARWYVVLCVALVLCVSQLAYQHLLLTLPRISDDSELSFSEDLFVGDGAMEQGVEQGMAGHGRRVFTQCPYTSNDLSAFVPGQDTCEDYMCVDHTPTLDPDLPQSLVSLPFVIVVPFESQESLGYFMSALTAISHLKNRGIHIVIAGPSLPTRVPQGIISLVSSGTAPPLHFAIHWLLDQGSSLLSPNAIVVIGHPISISQLRPDAITTLNSQFLRDKPYIITSHPQGIIAMSAHLLPTLLDPALSFADITDMLGEERVNEPTQPILPVPLEHSPPLDLLPAHGDDPGEGQPRGAPSDIHTLAGADVVHVVMCTHSRPRQFPRIVRELMQQDIQHPIHLSICNNNAEDEGIYRAALGHATQHHTFNHLPFTYSIVSFPANAKGYARFLIATDLWRTRKIEHVVFLDDDVTIGRPALRQLWQGRVSLGVVSTYCKQFGGQSDQLSYWRTPMHLWSCGLRKDNPPVPVHYAGTGFMVADVATIALLEASLRIPIPFYSVEDMWLSYVVWGSGGQVLWLPKVDVMFDAVPREDRLSGQWKPLRNIKQGMLGALRKECGFGMFWPVPDIEVVVKQYCFGGTFKTCKLSGCEAKLKEFRQSQENEISPKI